MDRHERLLDQVIDTRQVADPMTEIAGKALLDLGQQNPVGFRIACLARHHETMEPGFQLLQSRIQDFVSRAPKVTRAKIFSAPV